ncbi:MAG: RNA methyltransferase [Gammaproteobacteria bacterium]|nr:RNA methyltransferase [Gammaproteobacteria bacterium]
MNEKVSIVLVRTTHPGNIGAVARAMRVMGLHRLVLVDPRCRVGSVARARASGAVDVLDHARVVESIDEAIAEAGFVVGTSARKRSLGPQVCALRSGMAECMREQERGEVAILFGPERNGLDNAALERCNRLWYIPTAQDYASLNLSAAVQVVASELFAAGADAPPGDKPPAVASAGEVAGLITHFEEVARAVNFVDADAPRQAFHRVERLFHRARLEPAEVKLLRGFLTAVERRKRQSNER